MTKTRYVIYTEDGIECGEFKTLKQAKQKIKDLKRFDKENGNPFNEQYIIEMETIDYDNI